MAAKDTATATEQSLRDLARPLEFAFVGVAPAERSPHADYIRRWLADGRHGEMHYLARNVAARIDPGQLVTGARTVICVADRYHGDADAGADTPPAAQGSSGSDTAAPAAPARAGRVARYAWSDDYHRIIKKRLHQLADALRRRWPGHAYRASVDTAPVLEREHAVRAGLGWIGKHTLLIHPDAGSWLLLGQIVTTLPVAKTGDADQIPDHCGTCTRCIDACPTACIDPRGYRLDAKRCISYLTIEHRGAIDSDLHVSMGEWVAGCDICQEVCPFNRDRREPSDDSRVRSQVTSGDDLNSERARSSRKSGTGGSDCHPAYAPRPPAPGMDLLDVLDWSEQDRRAAFQRSALKRIKLEPLKRNAMIAADNAPDGESRDRLRQRIRAFNADAQTPDLLRQTAQQVTARWSGDQE